MQKEYRLGLKKLKVKLARVRVRVRRHVMKMDSTEVMVTYAVTWYDLVCTAVRVMCRNTKFLTWPRVRDVQKDHGLGL